VWFAPVGVCAQFVAASAQPPASLTDMPDVIAEASKATSALGNLLLSPGLTDLRTSLLQLPAVAIRHFFPPFPDLLFQERTLVDEKDFAVRKLPDGRVRSPVACVVAICAGLLFRCAKSFASLFEVNSFDFVVVHSACNGCDARSDCAGAAVLSSCAFGFPFCVGHTLPAR
jgi:hypothetical protein